MSDEIREPEGGSSPPSSLSPSETTGLSGSGAGFLGSGLFWVGLVALGLTAFLYYPLFFPPDYKDLANQSAEFFFQPNEAAGAPVLVLAAWLFYRRSHLLDVLSGPGWPLAGFGALALAVFLFGWGQFTSAPDIQLFSVIPLVFGALLVLGGSAALRAYWVPVLFLGFALPLSPVLLSAAIYSIQLWTASYAGVILNAIGVASYVQGDQILRPENTFIVIETCSGVRTIVTLSMLTVLLIDLFERRGWHAVALMAMAPIVAFITNGFRVVTLVLNPHSSIHSIHNLQGIVMLLVGLTGMYLLDSLLERIWGSPEGWDEEDGYEIVRNGAAAARPRLGFAVGIVAFVIAMLGVSRFVDPWRPAGGLSEMPDVLLSRVFGERMSRPIPPDFQFRGSVRYLAHANRRVRFEGEPMEVFLGIGNEQIREHTVLTKRLGWPESGFAPIEESVVEFASGEQALRLVLRRGARSVLSYSWYEREGKLATEWFRQAVALDRSPWVRPDHILALRISTPLGPGGSRVEEAEERIRRAWERLEPELEGYAPTDPATASDPVAKRS